MAMVEFGGSGGSKRVRRGRSNKKKRSLVEVGGSKKRTALAFRSAVKSAVEVGLVEEAFPDS